MGQLPGEAVSVDTLSLLIPNQPCVCLRASKRSQGRSIRFCGADVFCSPSTVSGALATTRPPFVHPSHLFLTRRLQMYSQRQKCGPPGRIGNRLVEKELLDQLRVASSWPQNKTFIGLFLFVYTSQDVAYKSVSRQCQEAAERLFV